jgi:hypothetical protein
LTDEQDIVVRLGNWVRPSTQPRRFPGDIEHPVVDDCARAADEIQRLRQRAEAAEAREQNLLEERERLREQLAFAAMRLRPYEPDNARRLRTTLAAWARPVASHESADVSHNAACVSQDGADQPANGSLDADSGAHRHCAGKVSSVDQPAQGGGRPSEDDTQAAVCAVEQALAEGLIRGDDEIMFRLVDIIAQKRERWRHANGFEDFATAAKLIARAIRRTGDTP